MIKNVLSDILHSPFLALYLSNAVVINPAMLIKTNTAVISLIGILKIPFLKLKEVSKIKIYYCKTGLIIRFLEVFINLYAFVNSYRCAIIIKILSLFRG